MSPKIGVGVKVNFETKPLNAYDHEERAFALAVLQHARYGIEGLPRRELINWCDDHLMLSILEELDEICGIVEAARSWTPRPGSFIDVDWIQHHMALEFGLECYVVGKNVDGHIGTIIAGVPGH